MGRKRRSSVQMRYLAAFARKKEADVTEEPGVEEIADAPAGALDAHVPDRAPMPLPRSKKPTAEIPRIHIQRSSSPESYRINDTARAKKEALAQSREYWQKLPPLRPAPRITPVGPVGAPQPSQSWAYSSYAPKKDEAAPALVQAQHAGMFTAQHREEPPPSVQQFGTYEQENVGDYDSYSGNGYDGYEPPKKRRKKKSKGKKTFFRVICFALCLVLLVGATLGGIGYSYAGRATDGDESALDLDLLKANGGLISGTVLYAQDAAAPGEWQVYQRFSGQVGGEWQALSEMPSHLPAAVIAIEQPSYYSQSGAAVGYTVKKALFGMAGRSASTIEQQLARRLMQGEETETGDNTVKRKLREMSWAQMLGSTYTKDTILEAYLNTLRFTGGAVGVDGAARLYFGKTVQELTLAECATIAGLIYAPYTYDPFTKPDECLARRNLVLQCMRDQGKIDAAAYEEAAGQPLDLAAAPAQDAPANVFTWFTDLVYQQLVSDLMAELGMSREAAAEYLYNNNLKVYTTVDTGMQAYMEQLYAKNTELFAVESGAAQGAMVVLSYSGEVCGIVGGTGTKVASLVFNRASQSLVQPGTALRPVTVYASAIEAGLIDYSTLMIDEALEVEIGEDGAKIDWPRNLDGTPSGDNILVCDAFTQMTNTVAAKTGMRVGVDEMYAFAQNQAGITSLVGSGEATDRNLAALALGSTTHGVSLLELAASYQMFGNGGQYNQPCTYYSVSDAQNNTVLQPETARWRAIETDTAWVMQTLLRENLQTQSGDLLPEGVQGAGYFGYDSNDVSQVFVGMTPNYVTAVWRGMDEPTPLGGTGGAPGKNATLLAWKQVMENTTQAQTEFAAKPQEAVRAEYCVDTGMLAGEHCPEVRVGAYTADRVPELCTEHD